MMAVAPVVLLISTNECDGAGAGLPSGSTGASGRTSSSSIRSETRRAVRRWSFPTDPRGTMSGTVLQVNFKLNVPPAEYEQTVTPMADAIAKVDGLRWKVWILNQEEREAGGLYLFEDEPSCAAFLAGPLAAALKSAPFL